ncbi:MAG: hypothetical protein IPK69_01965 [Phycisphaerales bacterium]|nr:MAG: hypothetical protein IPK69_01965 [Phycisphaerales bacterium]
MSVSQCVVCHRDRIPTTDAVADRSRMHGFDLQIDHANLLEHTGFLPSTLGGKSAGFEWYIDDTSVCKDIGIDPEGRDCVCTLVTHSDETECQSAMIVAGVLLELTRGVYFDDSASSHSDPFRLLSEAREWIQRTQ